MSEELIEVLARNCARQNNFPNQGREHLDGKGYRTSQEKLSWPERDDDGEEYYSEGLEVERGRAFYRKAAQDILDALEVAGYEVHKRAA